MKYTIRPQSVFSLTSDQIEQALANAFLRFVKTTSKPYRKDIKFSQELFPQNSQRQSRPHCVIKTNELCSQDVKSGKRQKTKGHVPIRSQTGHDHDRNHQKH